MFGSIIPEPFATQVIVAPVPGTVADNALAYVSVVMIPSAPTSGSATRSCDMPTSPASIVSIGKADADDARRAHQNARRRGPDLFCRGGRHPPSRLHTFGPRGDVAVLAVRDDRPKYAAADRLSSQQDRRARKLVSREDRGRRGIDLAHEEREVLRRRLETAVPARAPEPARKNGFRVKIHTCSGCGRGTGSA